MMVSISAWLHQIKDRPRRRRRPTIEVLEDRTVPAAFSVDYAVTQDWGSGFQGTCRINNLQANPIANWRLEFDFAANITSIWDAHIVSHSGNHYVIGGANWNNTLAGNGSIMFGFVANPGHVAAPINFTLNGASSNPPAALPTLTVGDVTLVEGNTGSTQATFTVDLSAPSATPVTVRYATSNGTAQAGSDYQVASDTLIFGPGQTRRTVAIAVIGDTQVEPNETFIFTLSNPTGATIVRGQAMGTVTNDDTPPSTPAGNVQFRVTSDWGSGFNGEITIRNPGATALNGWRLEFDFPGQITSIWDAQTVSHIGNRYVVTHAVWNGTIAAGGTVTFGFTASPGGGAAQPTNFVLTSATGNPPGGNPAPVPAPAWPAQVFAPYVDMTLYPMYDLVNAAQTSGVNHFTLAFIVADPQNRPSWGGYAEYAVNGGAFDSQVRAQINTLRKMGGDVMVSFGGAANQELAQVITDVSALQRAYQSVIDAYGLTHIDFDIEGAAVADQASIDRRSQAIAGLQSAAAAAGKELRVWFTLPVLPTGLTNDGLSVLQSALRYGVRIDGVNVMAMDYGDSAAPQPQGRMGDYAIQAATSLQTQLKGLYGSAKTDAQLWRMIGVTPMIGLNDVITETFDQQEARELLAFAQQMGLGMLSMWSLNRDKQNPHGQINYVEPTSSSLAQQPFEFARMFQTFNR